MRALLVLVTGSRDWRDAGPIEAALNRLDRKNGRVRLVIEGGARGADQFAADWADNNGIAARRFNADWDRWDRKAGGIRNQDMVDHALLFQGDLRPVCLAFPRTGSRGTWDMVRRCRKAGIPVRVVEP